MTEFRVIIGEHIKKRKELEISEAIDILSSIKATFKNNTVGKKTAYSLHFADLIDGSSDIVFKVDTDNENNVLQIIPSYDLAKLCLNDFKEAKQNIISLLHHKKKTTGIKKFFATTRKIQYKVKVQIGKNKDDCIEFTQEDSIKIFDTINADKGIKTCVCKAEVFAIDVIKRKIGLKVLESKLYDKGEEITLSINQTVVDYCIRHHIQIGDIVSATTEVEQSGIRKKHRLLNIYSNNINGLNLYD